MDTRKQIIFVALIALLQLSCSSNDAQHNIKVFKSDGSLQCESLEIGVDVMALELINIGVDVICSQKGHDGFLHLTVCGADTGRINIYTINSSNLPDAETIGFAPVNILPDYQDEECE